MAGIWRYYLACSELHSVVQLVFNIFLIYERKNLGFRETALITRNLGSSFEIQMPNQKYSYLEKASLCNFRDKSRKRTGLPIHQVLMATVVMHCISVGQGPVFKIAIAQKRQNCSANTPYFVEEAGHPSLPVVSMEIPTMWPFQPSFFFPAGPMIIFCECRFASHYTRKNELSQNLV